VFRYSNPRALSRALHVASALLFAASAGAAGPATLSIAWFDWPPCQNLKKLVAAYPNATVTVECPPTGEWHSSIFSSFAARKGADLVFLDSQWIGEAVKGGHIPDIGDWMHANLPMSDYIPAALSAYGEYPAGSGRLYAVPAQADTQVLVYRKDLLAAAGLQPPTTWSELRRQSQLLAQDPQKGGAGAGFVTHWCGLPSCYDQVQCAWNQIAWSFGGDLWDSTKYQIRGILDSPANTAALDLARDLVKTGPEGAADYQFADVTSAMCSGRASMATIWFGFASSFLDPATCPQAPNLGYAVVPGEKRHFISLGGQGIAVSAYSPNREAALEFIKWFQSDEQQLAWARLGGVPARRSILGSDTFAGAAAYNPAFAASYGLVKDFWNLPEYNQLLAIQGTLLNLALKWNSDSQATLYAMATLQQEVVNQAYPAPPFAPVLAQTGPLNAASLQGGAIAPGEMVAISGSAIGPGIAADYVPEGGRAPLSLDGTQVLFDDLEAPVLYTSASRIMAVVPYAVAGRKSVNLSVRFLGRSAAGPALTVAEAAPGVFTLDSTGKGQALAFNADGAPNGPAAPAAKGSLVRIYATGVGALSPAGIDGEVGTSLAPNPALPVSVRIGGEPVDSVTPVARPGITPGMVAFEVRIPLGSPSGTAVPLVLIAGNTASQASVTLAIQ